MKRSQDCEAAARVLQDLVRERGGDPETRGSISGSLHRRWINIKTAILGQHDQAILEECERGEDVALQSYRRALAKELPPEVRLVVERQYEGVLTNHELVKNLRDQVQMSI